MQQPLIQPQVQQQQVNPALQQIVVDDNTGVQYTVQQLRNMGVGQIDLPRAQWLRTKRYVPIVPVAEFINMIPNYMLFEQFLQDDNANIASATQWYNNRGIQLFINGNLNVPELRNRMLQGLNNNMRTVVEQGQEYTWILNLARTYWVGNNNRRWEYYTYMDITGALGLEEQGDDGGLHNLDLRTQEWYRLTTEQLRNIVGTPEWKVALMINNNLDPALLD